MRSVLTILRSVQCRCCEKTRNKTKDQSKQDDCTAGIAQWLERRTRDRKVAGSSPGRNGGRIVFSAVKLSVLTVISVSVPPSCCRSNT